MCLTITAKSLEETKALKAKHKPIIAYKILRRDMSSVYKNDCQWKLGLNISDRESSVLSLTEINLGEVR